ncbi:hypothetical protein F7725_014376, partial [Dissostichus mawsoni]
MHGCCSLTAPGQQGRTESSSRGLGRFQLGHRGVELASGSVMNSICLILHISDMFQFNVTYSLAYITQCQDLRLQGSCFCTWLILSHTVLANGLKPIKCPTQQVLTPDDMVLQGVSAVTINQEQTGYSIIMWVSCFTRPPLKASAKSTLHVVAHNTTAPYGSTPTELDGLGTLQLRLSAAEPSELPEHFKGLQVIRLPPDALNVQPQLS